jgi:iron(III) transport system ATP-binding protein
LRQLDATVLLVTHDPEEAMLVADRIALMRAGRLVQQGLPNELYDAPVDRDVAAFFSTVNVLDAIVRGGEAATPLGSFDAKAFSEGTEVEVLLRPQALLLAPAGQGVAARVRSARALGAETELTLEVEGDGPVDAVLGLRLKARLRGRLEPREDSRVFVTVARDAAQVVPCSKRGPSVVDTSGDEPADRPASA